MNSLLHLLIRAAWYPSLWFHHGMCAIRLWNHWDWVDDHVLLGAFPARGDVSKLEALGVSAVVNMCGEFEGHVDEMVQCGIDQLHLPTVDFCSPTTEDLRCGAEFVQEQVVAGRKVYVHCKAGRGRGPSLVMCYLMLSTGCSAAEAHRLIQQRRRQIDNRIVRRGAILELEAEWSNYSNAD